MRKLLIVILFLITSLLSSSTDIDGLWNEVDRLLDRIDTRIEELEAGRNMDAALINEISEDNHRLNEINHIINTELNVRDTTIIRQQEQIRIAWVWIRILGGFAVIIILGKIAGLILKARGMWAALPKLVQWAL